MAKKIVNLSIRIEEDLLDLIQKELDQRRRREPWRRHSVGTFIRESAYLRLMTKVSD